MLERRGILIAAGFVAVLVALLLLVWTPRPFATQSPSTRPLASRGGDLLPSLDEGGRDAIRTSEAQLPNEVDRDTLGSALGRIDFVPAPGDALESGDAWTLVHRPEGEVRRLSRSAVATSIEVAPGTYELETVAGPRRCWPATFRVERDRSTTIWVGSSHALRVLVVNHLGTPIEGVLAEWVHLDARGRPAAGRPEARATTGLDGQAILDIEGPVARGGLRCSRVGFSPEEITFVTAPTVPMRIVLAEASAPQWAGRVQDCETGTPMARIDVHDGEGFLLATSATDGLVHVPAGAGRKGALQLRGRGIATSWVEAPRESGFRLCAVPTVRQEFRTGSGTLPVQFDLVVFGGDEVDGSTTNSEHRSVVADGPSTFLDLPRGALVLALALDAAGTRGQVELLVQSPSTPCEIAWSESDDHLVVVVEGQPGAAVVVEPVYETHVDLPPWIDAGREFRLPFASRLRRIHIRAPGAVPLALVRAPTSQGPRSGGVTVRPRPASRCDLVVVDEQGLPISGVRVHISPDRPPDALGVSGPSAMQSTDHAGWRVQDDMRSAFVTNERGLAVLAPVPAGPHWVSLGTPSEFRVASGSDLYQQQFRGLDVPEGRSSVTWTVPRPVTLLVEAVEAGTGRPVDGVQVRLDRGLANSVGDSSGHFWHGWLPASATRLSLSAKGYSSVDLELPPPGARGSSWFARAEFRPGRDGRISLVGVPVDRLRGRTVRLLAEEYLGDVWVMRWNGSVMIDADGGVDLALPLDEAHLTLQNGQSTPALTFEPGRQRWTRGAILEFFVNEP